MSIKEIREAALKADNKTQKALDHKSKFTDEQLLLLSERVEFAINNICRLVKILLKGYNMNNNVTNILFF